jgi:hypothetical protein
VEGFARDVLDLHHAASCRLPARSRIASTTSTALAKPSSWKPFFIQAPQNQVLRAVHHPDRSCAAQRGHIIDRMAEGGHVVDQVLADRAGAFSVTNSGSSCGMGCSEFIQ